MRWFRCLLFVAFCPGFVACAVGPRAPLPAGYVQSDPGPDAGRPGLQLAAFFVPFLAVDADVDDDEKNGGILFEPDLKTGEGAAFVASNELTHVMFLTSEHRDRPTGDEVDHYALLFGFHTESPIDLSGDDQLRLIPGFGAGVGLAGFDYAFAYNDEIAGALHVEGGLALGVGPNLRISTQVGYLLYGYPGESVAHAFYGGIGGALSF